MSTSETSGAMKLMYCGRARSPRSAGVSLIIGLAASTAIFLPVSTPPNATAYATGLLDQKDFRVGGAVIGAIGPIAAIAWVLLCA